jgi:hypothetical protein
MIRHASPSGTVSTVSFGVHGTPARCRLVASPSFSLRLTAGCARADSSAVHLAPIAASTDEDLATAASAQEHPARHRIGTCVSASRARRILAFGICQSRQFQRCGPPPLSSKDGVADSPNPTLSCDFVRPKGRLNLPCVRLAITCGYVDNVTPLPTYPQSAATNNQCQLDRFDTREVRSRSSPSLARRPARLPHVTAQLHHLSADPGSRSQLNASTRKPPVPVAGSRTVSPRRGSVTSTMKRTTGRGV